MTRDEIIEQMEQIHHISNCIMEMAGKIHPGTLVAGCAMAAGSIGTVCNMSKEKFMEHMNGMVEQAWDRQLEAQAAMAKDHGPLQ